MPEYITQTEAAEYLGISLRAVTRAITEQRLGVVEQYGKRLLLREEVESYQPNGSQAKGRQSRQGDEKKERAA